MRFALLAALTLALVGLTRGSATEADKQKFCGFLKEVETKRMFLSNSLARKAIQVGVEVSKMLDRSSSFREFINDKRHIAYSDPISQIKFLLRFRCNYKKMILCNRKYNSNPEYRSIYNAYKSESNAVIAEFDRKMERDANQMLSQMRSASVSTKDAFDDHIRSYLDRKGIVSHCMMDRFLERAKAEYECTYEMYYL
ncbi:uncharacterized protein LOC120458116 [Drosophila santomea]|uniref:uncharacterized protein LOC120458116 n=1 Tax=Drosophila santomea TaxID=129105 RepID=UPI001953255C|nr:uncharacterized protein LOC120458116 [Drosophila santomea]